jgi:chaperonin GroEL (HSP60 family)
MQTPVHTIASNAGVEGAVVVGKLLEQENTDLGYDAAKGMMSQHLPAQSFLSQTVKHDQVLKVGVFLHMLADMS